MKYTIVLLIVVGLFITIFGGLIGMTEGGLSMVLSGGIVTAAAISLLYYRRG